MADEPRTTPENTPKFTEPDKPEPVTARINMKIGDFAMAPPPPPKKED